MLVNCDETDVVLSYPRRYPLVGFNLFVHLFIIIYHLSLLVCLFALFVCDPLVHAIQTLMFSNQYYVQTTKYRSVSFNFWLQMCITFDFVRLRQGTRILLFGIIYIFKTCLFACLLSLFVILLCMLTSDCLLLVCLDSFVFK